jgi:predicted ATP-dependent serine protease
MTLPSCAECGSNNSAKSKHECKECAWSYLEEQRKRQAYQDELVKNGYLKDDDGSFSRPVNPEQD